MNHQIPRAVRSAILASTLILPFAATAAEDGASEAIDTITIFGRQTDVADVPGSAHKIGSEELEVFNTADILRALRSVPGVYLQEEEGFGLRPNIGIRGSGLDRSARIALLEDGILIAPAPYSAPSAYYFPTQRRMNALEVLKGPASVAIGPRTTGGAINMISTPIPDAMGVMADVRVGEHSTADAHIHAGNRGQRVSWLLETVQAGSDGFKTIEGPVGGDTGYDLEDYVAKLQIDSDPRSSIYQSLRVKLGYTEQDSSETYLGLIDDDFAATPYNRYAASANDRFQSEHEQYQATYVIDPGNSWRAQVTAYRNDFWRNWYKVQSVGGESISNVLEDPATFATELGYIQGVTSPDDAVQIRANNRNYYSQGVQASLQWDTSFGDTDIALTTGVRIHEDEEDRFQHQDGYRMEDGALVLTTAALPGSQTNRVSTADTRSLFVDAEIRTGNWILTPGVRFEDIDMQRLDYSTDDLSRSQGPSRVRENSTQVVIPGMGALYRVSEEWRLLAGLHKGFNPPAPGSSADEEESLNFEAGARYDSGNLSFEGIYFLNDYDNLVGTVTESTGGGGEIGDQFDGGEVRVSGLELSGAWNWQLQAVDVPFELRYTWTAEAEFQNAFESDFDPWGDVQVGDELPYIPEHQLRATAGLEANKWRFNIAANYVGKLRTRAGQGSFIPEESIDSHVVWDMVAAWQFTSQLSTYVKVDNLFDETYIAARRPAGVRPGLPRTAYLGLTYRL
ncbi:MAG: TonB-dependent receptor [Gammaproteobacteria bacterium]|jgi:Fe(3+) dicitrate transport protein|nr:TonB-dependent receptor [Gammaproteobacteria bacterium]MDH3865191.1 TonB-dependent receptor [Gammaproteobacteria bacterium]